MNTRPLITLAGAGSAAVVAAYVAYVCATWLRYGRHSRGRGRGADPLLDRFMPEYEVVDCHSSSVCAPAEVTFAAACNMDFEDSRIVRAIFRTREMLLRAGHQEAALPGGLLAGSKVRGWGVLAEVPGREIVMGAVTRPWAANVVFRAVAPEEFASFHDPGFVKIAWTLRADPVSAARSIFRTETRALACGPVSRSMFRKYWAFLSPGIILIRLAMLGPLKREAERRAREGAHTKPHDGPHPNDNPASLESPT